jgi:hypothetical protein
MLGGARGRIPGRGMIAAERLWSSWRRVAGDRGCVAPPCAESRRRAIARAGEALVSWLCSRSADSSWTRARPVLDRLFGAFIALAVAVAASPPRGGRVSRIMITREPDLRGLARRSVRASLLAGLASI